MAKNLRLLFLTLLCAVFNVSMAQEEFDLTSGYSNAEEVKTVTGQYATLTFSNGSNQSNSPKWYTTGTAVRMYGGNTLTITATKTMSSVVFTCASSNPITENSEVDEGTFDSSTATWSGSADEFTITNTATTGHWRIQKVTINYADGTTIKPTPGLSVADVTITEGEEKELEVTTKSDGAISFSSDDPDVADVAVDGTTYTLSANGVGTCTITVTQEETDEYLKGTTTFNVTVNEYVAPGEYPTVTLPYNETLVSSQGKFTIEDVLKGGLDAVWITSSYGMTANGRNCTSNVESWFISPLINASDAAAVKLTFDQNVRYFANTDKAKEEATLWVREGANGTWTQITIPNMENMNNNNFSPAGDIDLSAYAGKTFQLGFKYTGTTTSPGRWEIKNLAVTAEQVVQKTDPELSYTVEGNAVEEFTAYLNEENTFPVLNNPYSVPVTYKSQNEDIATIDADGNITLKDKEGNTDITATFEGNETYNGAEVKYTLHVRERAVAGTDVYTLVTSTDDLVDGDEIIIVNEANTYAIAKHAGINNRPAESVELEDDGTIIPSSAIAKITLKGEEDAWNFYVHTGDGQGYLYAASTSANQLKTQENVDEKATATITIDDNSVANVVFQNSASGARNHLRYNESSQLFSCYAESSNVTGLVRIYKMANDKDPAGLAYSDTEFTYTIGGENGEFPTLSNPNQLPVTYSSSEESVATINDKGEVTIVAAGETTITASTVGDATHRPGEASYTLTVKEVFVGKTYELVTNAKTLKAGDKIILVSPERDYAMSTNQASNNRRTAEVEPNEDGTITAGEDVEVINLGGEEGAWTLAVSGGYLYAPGGGNYLRTRADAAEVTIDINGEAGAEIIFIVDEAITQKYLRYNANNKLFSCYAEGSNVKDLPRIYREARDYEEVEITAAGYATMYYGYKNLEVPTGVTAKTYKADANGLSESKTYAAGSVIPAGTAVVLEGNEGMYTFNATEEEGTVDANNMLLGFDYTDITVGPDEGGSYLFYALSQSSEGEVGFYFMEEKGAAFTSSPHKAYLAVPAEMAASFYSFDSGSDGINNVVTNVNANDDVYSLSGVRMNGKLNKGIYIKNGKKVVIK